MKHYEQINNVRTIHNNIEHFVWHRDKYDREINIISGENWFLQIQHELPKRMNAGQCMFIRKKVWHRVFCINSNEKNDLVISILELNQEEV